MKTLKGLITVVVLSLVFYMPVVGQDKADEQVFFEVDKMPEYPGGFEKLKAFISENISYPGEAKKEGIQGKVFISFTIDKKGEVVNAEVVQSVHSAIDEEALRVVESMPAWTPGKKDGHVVNVRVTLPVQFKIDREKKD